MIARPYRISGEKLNDIVLKACQCLDTGGIEVNSPMRDLLECLYGDEAYTAMLRGVKWRYSAVLDVLFRDPIAVLVTTWPGYLSEGDYPDREHNILFRGLSAAKAADILFDRHD